MLYVVGYWNGYLVSRQISMAELLMCIFLTVQRGHVALQLPQSLLPYHVPAVAGRPVALSLTLWKQVRGCLPLLSVVPSMRAELGSNRNSNQADCFGTDSI